ncbi:transmembrane protein, putative (macronuclear) [Tetrahymena thermophila SB210]|uniref:Transmembrane protein, putative n=1 Tax=Tetrahymena thermophila (strain SB210) TaxID=312017 RepID=Q23YJ1_TETTS|nr:transmembrane protein, putative [Tetrahymena thermophila SB210]EAS01581.2 transmembrane protein, putative [Tetrahymena thermophila SB210]|eukprot:XP_001021826.2 transmembrane protein, putative [Tetrahymena thermophila SB210]
MRIKLFVLIIVPITLAFLSSIASLLIALYYNNIYIQEYSDNLFNDKIKFSSSHTQYISYRLSKEIYKFPYFLNIINSFVDKVIQGQVKYNPRHHKSFYNNILAFVNLEDEYLTRLVLKNTFLVDGWYLPDEVYINNLDNLRKTGIPFKTIFYASDNEGFLFSTFSNTSFSQVVDKKNINAKHEYDPRKRLWYQNNLNQTSFYMNSPNLSLGNETPYLSQFGCQKLFYLNPNTRKVEIHHIQCLDAMISNLSTYFQTVIESSKQYYVIDPRTFQIVFNSKKVYDFSSITKIDNFYNVELQFLEDQQQSNYFKNLINNNYNKWIFDTSNDTKTNLQQMVNQSQYQMIFDYQRNQSVYKVIINPIIGFDDIPKYITRYLGNKGQQLEYVYLQINMISDEDLRAETNQLIKLSTILLIVASIFISLNGLLLVCAIYQYLLLVKNQVYNPINKLTQILQKIDLLKKQCDINEIIVEFQLNADDLFLSKETKMLYNSFYELFQQLQYLSEHFFIENEGKTLVDLNKKVSFFKKFKNYYAVGIAHNNIGCILLNQKHYFQSLEHFESSIICAKYEIQEFCDQTDNIHFIKILQPYSFSEQNIQNNIANSSIKQYSFTYRNRSKEKCASISRIKQLSIYNNQTSQSKIKQQKMIPRMGMGESQIINEINCSQKNRLRNSFVAKNTIQIDYLSKEDEQYQELQELISNLVFRKLNYITTLIILQQDLNDDQNQKSLYNFWGQIKQLTKELIPLVNILHCQENIKAVCECIFSKCYYNMNKFQKAQKRIQQSKNIVKNQYEQLQKSIIERTNLQKNITKQRSCDEKLNIKQINFANENQNNNNNINSNSFTKYNTFDILETHKTYVLSPRIQNSKVNKFSPRENRFTSQKNILSLSNIPISCLCSDISFGEKQKLDVKYALQNHFQIVINIQFIQNLRQIYRRTIAKVQQKQEYSNSNSI